MFTLLIWLHLQEQLEQLKEKQLREFEKQWGVWTDVVTIELKALTLSVGM